MKEFNSTKVKILDRTLYLIGKKGAVDIPIRDIAKEAGVNVGAINYHFQSKELMFEQMEEFFISNFDDAYKVLYDDHLDAKQKILKWANEVMEYTLRYPGILVLIKEKMNSHDNNKLAKFLLETSKESYEIFNHVIRECLNIKDDKVFEFNKMIFVSSIVFPVADQIEISEFRERFLKDSNLRLEYIEHLLNLVTNIK